VINTEDDFVIAVSGSVMPVNQGCHDHEPPADAVLSALGLDLAIRRDLKRHCQVSTASYFSSRMTIVATSAPAMRRWQKRLFMPWLATHPTPSCTSAFLLSGPWCWDRTSRFRSASGV
jgi:hypothetical protein